MNTDFPITCLAFKDDLLLVGGGGGVSRTGVKNKLICLDSTVEFQDCPWSICVFEDSCLLGVSHQGYSLYELKVPELTLKSRLKTIDDFEQDYVCSCAMKKGVFASGSDLGILYCSGKKINLKERINSLVFFQNDLYASTTTRVLCLDSKCNIKLSLQLQKIQVMRICNESLYILLNDKNSKLQKLSMDLKKEKEITLSSSRGVSMAVVNNVCAVGFNDCSVSVLKNLKLTETKRNVHYIPAMAIAIRKKRVFVGCDLEVIELKSKRWILLIFILFLIWKCK